VNDDSNPVDVMDTWLQSRLEDLHTTLPGTIQNYDPDTRLATVVPMVRLNSLHGDIIEIKPIAAVPVVWPGCSRFSVIPKALEAGDGVILHFAESAIGNWLNGQGVQDAEDQTRFSLHDCIAVPGLFQTRATPAHDLGGADFGLAGDRGEVLGGKAGKLDLHTQNTHLRAELEKLWDAIDTLAGHLQNLTTTNAAVGVPCTQNPVTRALIQTTQRPGWESDKAALKGLLA
jgi:Phage protein Gp138 N-terminal domain